jgi:D-alanyl-D-alanine dipeptidase
LRQFFLVAAIALIADCAPAQEARHPSFVNVADAVAGIVVDMRYFGERNFVGHRIDGYEQPVCLLTREAADALANVQRDLAMAGLGLKVFDCYRPARAVAHFIRWAREVSDQRMKSEFYPDVDKRNLFRDGYLSARSGHSRGSTVDLSLVRLSDGKELDMGSPFDFFGSRSWRTDRTISAESRANRQLLAAAMQRRGFRPYEKEWWHFTLSREPFPGSYFDFPVR